MRPLPLSMVSACVITMSAIAYGCTTTAKETADQTQSQSGNVQASATGSTATNSSVSSANFVPQSLRINEATVVLAFTKPQPEKICGRFIPAELITTLYANEIKPDDRSTFTITDIQVTELNAAAHTFMAVVKREHIGSGNDCIFDVFAFRDSTESKPVLAHTTYEPEFANAEITGVQQKKYQITDDEYALAFEWTATQLIEGKQQTTSMLCLFRVQDDMMQNIFELCTYSNVGDDVATEGGEYETALEDRASLETMKTWGKDLFSILVTRTQTRKSAAAEPVSRSETRKTKTLYQWDGMQYVQTNQLL